MFLLTRLFDLIIYNIIFLYVYLCKKYIYIDLKLDFKSLLIGLYDIKLLFIIY